MYIYTFHDARSQVKNVRSLTLDAYICQRWFFIFKTEYVAVGETVEMLAKEGFSTNYRADRIRR